MKKKKILVIFDDEVVILEMLRKLYGCYFIYILIMLRMYFVDDNNRFRLRNGRCVLLFSMFVYIVL